MQTSFNDVVDGDDAFVPQRAMAGPDGDSSTISVRNSARTRSRNSAASLASDGAAERWTADGYSTRNSNGNFNGNSNGYAASGYGPSNGAAPSRGNAAVNSNNYRNSHVRMASMQEGTPQSVTQPPRTAPNSPMPPSGPMGATEEMPPGHMMPGEMSTIGPEMGEMEGGAPGPGCNGGGCCNAGGCNSCCCIPLCGLFCGDWYEQWFSDLSIFTGVQGFKGPSDQGSERRLRLPRTSQLGSALWDAMGIGRPDRLRG